MTAHKNVSYHHDSWRCSRSGAFFAPLRAARLAAITGAIGWLFKSSNKSGNVYLEREQHLPIGEVVHVVEAQASVLPTGLLPYLPTYLICDKKLPTYLMSDKKAPSAEAHEHLLRGRAFACVAGRICTRDSASEGSRSRWAGRRTRGAHSP